VRDENSTREAAPNMVEMPAPTAYPIVFAMGLTLLAAGLVTYFLVSLVGGVLFLVGLVGWYGQLLSEKGTQFETIRPPAERPQPPEPSPAQVEELRPGMPGYRLRIPEKYHPYSAGAVGGLIGSVAMAVSAMLYGILSGHGPWYPINLLAGVLLPSIEGETVAQLKQFSLLGLVVASVIHLTISVSVGLIYGILLPMLPHRPILWGGIVLPLLWTGATHGFIGVLNPALGEHVVWSWFLVSQIAYGLTVGLYVVRTERIEVPP
jgi:hypothetical protein